MDRLTCARGLRAGFVAAIGLAAALISVAAPEANASAEAAPTTQETPVTFRGTVNGRSTAHSVDLREGLVVVRGRHSGGTNFQLTLALPRPGKDVWREREEAISLFNERGEYDGGAAGRVRQAGTYVLALYASGSYEITIEQPPLSQVADEGQLEFSGAGHQVTPVVMVPAGARRITFTHDGQASFGPRGLAQLWLLDMGGNKVGGDVSGRLVNDFGPYNGTIELEIILDGPHIFHVDATGRWSLRID